jgi:two-component sensor histidine kinase
MLIDHKPCRLDAKMPQKFRAFRDLPSFKAARQPLSRRDDILSGLASLLLFAAAFAFRLWLDPMLPAGFPYLTFFPAVVIAGFIFGVRHGVAVAVLSGIASWYFFIPPHYSFHLSTGSLMAMALYVFVVATDLFLIHLMIRAYGAELAARRQIHNMAEQQTVMAMELDHRLKNIFATMNAVISLSQKFASSPEDLAAKLRDRLNAMGRSNLLLRGMNPGDESTLASVLQQALEPFGIVGTSRLSINGDRIAVSAQAVVVLSLILHELGTNAAKYGALSVASGRIELNWATQSTQEDCPVLTLVWRELDGPSPQQPLHEEGGFGSKLMTRVIATLNGQTDISFPQEGAVVTISVPLSAISPTPAGVQA